MNRILYPIISLLFFPLCLSAQNFNESVEVTNELQVDLSGSERKTIEMEIPDSLSQFRLDFDYEVFSRPYKGAYEFTPYNVLFRPLAQKEKNPFFYLRAGAGFAFNPELLAVVSPRLGDKFRLNVYQDFSAFSGDYRGKADFIYRGYEAKELLGVQGNAYLKKSELDFDLFYRGIWASDFNCAYSPFHTFGAKLGLSSTPASQSSVEYELDLSFRSSVEKEQASDLTENLLDFSGLIRPVIDFPVQAEVLFNTGFDFYGISSNHSTYYLKLNPRLTYRLKQLYLRGGFVFSLYTGEMRYQPIAFYPDVRLSLRLFKNSMDLFAGIDGGDNLNSLYSLKAANPHFNRLYIQDDWSRMLKTSAVKANYFIGLKGSIASLFQYELRAGYAKHKAGLLYGMDSVLESQAVLRYADYNLAYLEAEASFKRKSYEINAALKYRKMYYDIPTPDFFELPGLSANLDFTYNWIERIYAGASLRLQSGRESQIYDTLPPYFDLGLHLSAELNSSLSLWLRGKNLLFSRVEDVPFTAQRWPEISLGLCLIFR